MFWRKQAVLLRLHLPELANEATLLNSCFFILVACLHGLYFVQTGLFASDFFLINLFLSASKINIYCNICCFISTGAKL